MLVGHHLASFPGAEEGEEKECLVFIDYWPYTEMALAGTDF